MVGMVGLLGMLEGICSFAAVPRQLSALPLVSPCGGGHVVMSALPLRRQHVVVVPA